MSQPATDAFRAGVHEAGANVLYADHITIRFGGLVAVSDVSFGIPPRSIVSLIGPNGAGKSTTLRTISGLLRPRAGEVIYKGRSINGMPGHEVVKLGVCHAPEGRKIFHRMTVSENLDLGAFVRKDSAKIAEDRAWVLELFPPLRERINQKAGTLSGGEQQMLAVARALLGNPALLLLDERHGTGSSARRSYLSDHRADPPAGRHCSARRTECAGRPGNRRLRLRLGIWQVEPAGSSGTAAQR